LPALPERVPRALLSLRERAVRELQALVSLPEQVALALAPVLPPEQAALALPVL
jgi:hypothetical protein